MNRVGDYGYPADVLISRRFNGLFPNSIINSIIENASNKNFDHARYGLKPKLRPLEAHPTVNDALPNRILNGTIKIKPNVRSFNKTCVEFEDGTYEENIDNIILATGYKLGFPMIDPSIIQVEKNQVSFYKYVFLPNMIHATIAVIGLVQPIGSTIPIYESQSRWATRVFKGFTKLPNREKMWEDIMKKKYDMGMRYIPRERHTIQVDWIPYMDEVADEFGAKPNLKKLFFDDPRLAVRCIFGSCLPYQYRIMGPGKGNGAKEALETVWDRIDAPTKTRKVPDDATPKMAAFLKISIVIVILLAIIFYFI